MVFWPGTPELPARSYSTRSIPNSARLGNLGIGLGGTTVVDGGGGHNFGSPFHDVVGTPVVVVVIVKGDVGPTGVELDGIMVSCP